MVRYEPPSLASRCSGCCGRLATNCFPFYNGLRRPFKPKILRLVLALLYCAFGFVWMVLCGKLAAYRATKVRRYSIFMNYAYIMWLFILYLFHRTLLHCQMYYLMYCLRGSYIHSLMSSSTRYSLQCWGEWYLSC